MILFDQDKLMAGDILAVRGTTKIAKVIQWGQRRMMKHECKKRDDWEYIKPFSNHTGLFIPKTSLELWYIGEALPEGNVLTPIAEYVRAINAGEVEVRVYRIIALQDDERVHVAHNWCKHILGQPYDRRGLLKLARKAVFLGYIPGIAQNEFEYWCTEGVGNSCSHYVPLYNFFQTTHAIPMTLEQCAEELPRKAYKITTVANITDQVLITDNESEGANDGTA